MAIDVTPRSSAPAPPPSAPPSLSPRELARWAWRQLTSMRTALILLFLLALAAVPGSVIPQRDVDPGRVSQWQEEHTVLAPVYERLGLFSVYDSVWFSAIYVLLMVSLVGCIVPRTRVYWRGLRAQPPRTPRRLERLPQHLSFETDADPEAVLEAARQRVRAKRYRVRRTTQGDPGTDTDTDTDSVSAERGYSREAGNLLFHLSILVVLVGFAMGGLFGFRGGVIVVSGGGFSNSLSQYDEFSAGPLFDPDSLAPFDVQVDDFDLTFIDEGRQRGMASQFEAQTTFRSSPTAEPQQRELAVNHPLGVDDTDVFLIGHGYAPQITVRAADGTVSYSGPTVFLPEDATFRSFGVVPVPDTRDADGERAQLGLQGEFYPTFALVDGDPQTLFPDARNPVVSMLAYTGDLGMDDGVPQSIYSLDLDGLGPIQDAEGKPVRIDLMLGQTVELPDGLGTVSFDGLSRFVKLDVSETPGQTTALVGVLLALAGLLGSLYVRPRRIWVRARRAGEAEGGRTLVTVAGLDRSWGGDLSGELEELADVLRDATATSAPRLTPPEEPT